MNIQVETPLRIAAIGAGWHSRTSHLPALRRCVAESGDAFTLAALCEVDEELAAAAAAKFGFEEAFADIAKMLDEARPDAVVAVTPMALNVPCALDLIKRGIPALVEKPPGATVEEARSLARAAAEADTPVMVSMNRRFDPSLTAGVVWMGERPVYVHGTMLRPNRTSPEFMTGTGIHAVDAVRALGGDVAAFDCRTMDVNGITWYAVSLEFEGGGAGALDVIPTAGVAEERYELFADRRRVVIRTGMKDRGDVTCWEGGELALRTDPADGEPVFVRDGTYAETCEFLESIRQARRPCPTPQDVLQSVELCHKWRERSPR
jgi:predicted dehydrogenase